jgi:hypothetical protein
MINGSGPVQPALQSNKEIRRSYQQHPAREEGDRDRDRTDVPPSNASNRIGSQQQQMSAPATASAAATAKKKAGPVQPIKPEEVAEKPPDLLSFFPVSTLAILGILCMFKYELVVEVIGEYAYELDVSEPTLLALALAGVVLTMFLAKVGWYVVLKFQANRAVQKAKNELLARERDALVQIYESLGGAKWKKNQNWCSSKEVHTWKGVKLDHATGRVNKLLLPDNDLEGEIPECIGVLEQLVEIDVRINRIKGRIPQSLCGLQELQGLYLFENFLEGPIPEGLCRLPNLKGIYLLNNCLEGVEKTREMFKKVLDEKCIIYI